MKLELFKNKAGQWQIRMRADNGRILMHSQVYKSKQSAEKTAWMIHDSVRTRLFDVVERGE